MIRPPRRMTEPKAIDEGTDAFDTIDWLVKNQKDNNGRVGMLGISYPGWLTVMALLEPHPALKAASPQAPPADMFLGDDFHHNGAFRLSYGFEYAALMETSKVNSPFTFDHRDTFEWYLRLGPLSNANARYLKGKIPTWNDFVEHSSYDDFWRRQAVAPYLGRPKVPTLNVAGWWDQEDFYGPLKVYESFEKSDSENRNLLVVGPWNHGGWASGGGEKLGPVEFGSATGQHFRAKIQAPWFAAHLKGRGSATFPEAVTFRNGVEHLAVVRPLAAQGDNPAAALCTQERRTVPSSRPPPMKMIPDSMLISRTPTIPSLTGLAPSHPPTPDPTGRSGCCKTSDSFIFVPTFRATRPSRSPKM